MIDIKHLKKQEEELNIERKKAADERDVQKGKTIKIKLAEIKKEIAEQSKATEENRQLRNQPLPEVPIGKNETENVILREVGEKPKF
ncbi:MAG: hypothetical protein ABIH10_01040, partial [Spirochaetota bacterium]